MLNRPDRVEPGASAAPPSMAAPGPPANGPVANPIPNFMGFSSGFGARWPAEAITETVINLPSARLATMSECPTLETDRLHLRPFVDDDVEAYCALRHARGPPALHVADSFSRDDAWAHLALWRGQWAARHGLWAPSVETPGRLSDEQARTFPNEPVGRVWRSADTPPRPLGPRLRHRGGRAAVDWCFANHDVDELVSVILPENTASRPWLAASASCCPAATLPHFPQQPHGIGGHEAGDERRPRLRPVDDFTLLRVMMQVNCRMRSRSKGIFRKAPRPRHRCRWRTRHRPGRCPRAAPARRRP